MLESHLLWPLGPPVAGLKGPWLDAFLTIAGSVHFGVSHALRGFDGSACRRAARHQARSSTARITRACTEVSGFRPRARCRRSARPPGGRRTGRP